MKKLIKITFIVIAILFVANFSLNKYFFQTDLDREPELTNYKDSKFDLTSAKPFFFTVDKHLFYSANGKLDYSLKPIWDGVIEEAFISPNGQYALIYADNKLTLIDDVGKALFEIDDCTDLLAVEEDKKSGRFSGSNVQWGKNSDFFLIAQDRVWDKNFSKKNRSSIYKYSIPDHSFVSLIDLDEELEDNFMLSQNENYLYYECATPKGGLAFKKVNLKDHKVASEHYQNDSLKFDNMTADSVFFNYTKFKSNFQGNSYDLQSIITTANKSDAGLYYQNKDTTVKLLSGTSGYGAFKGISFSYFVDGFYLPGNHYFVANVSAKSFSGQIVIDTKTFKTMKLTKNTGFYFNVNSNDCKDFVFRYELEPNVKFATSVTLEIEGYKEKNSQ